MKKVEEGSHKLERKKVSPAILERVKLFNAALNLDYDEDDEFEGETYEEYVAREAKAPKKPNRTTAIEGFPAAFKVSLEYDDEDIIEVALFKAAMHHDQEKFSTLLSSAKLDPTVRMHVLNTSVQMACVFRDIDTVRFLEKNKVNLAKLDIVSDEGNIKSISPIGGVVSGFCSHKFFDEELIDLLFKNGADLKDIHFGTTVYFEIMGSVPEEFSIKMLKVISDLNEVQHERNIYCEEGSPDREEIEDSTYLNRAIISGRFKLAKAMIERGAKIEEDQIVRWLEHSIRLHNNFEFIEYLFKEGYIDSLKGLDGSENLLAEALFQKNYKLFVFLAQKGVSIEAKCDHYMRIEKDGIFESKHVYAPTMFAQLIKQASESDVLEVLSMIDLDVNAKLKDKYASHYRGVGREDSYLHMALRAKKYALAKKLVDLGADVNLPFNGTTPIHILLDDNQFEMVEYFVEKGADASLTQSSNRKSALQRVVKSGNMDLADSIIKHAADLQKLLISVLASAIYEQDIVAVKWLISKGVDFKGLENIWCTPPLIKAMDCSTPSEFDKLIDDGAMVNPIKEDSEFRGFLVSSGASIKSLRKIWDQSPLIEVISNYRSYTSLTKEALCQKLIEAGADVNIPDFRGRLPLNEACEKRNIKVVKYLISVGADLNAVDDCGQTPLIKVANPEICQILIDAGADVNFKPTTSGVDVWFCVRHKYEIAKIIVASGKLDLTGRDEHEVKKYNEIKAKMFFEEKVTADVEAVKAAHAEINSATIEPSFIPKKQVDAMLKYYLQGYKTKFAEEMKSGDAKFFDDLAGQVVESLNKYIKFSWHQLHDISKGLEVLVSTGEGDAEGEYLQAVPKGVIGLIGEYVVFNDTQEIVD